MSTRQWLWVGWALVLGWALIFLALNAVAGEPALKPGQSFRDCRDCPLMVVVPPGSFEMGMRPQDAAQEMKDIRGFALPRHTVGIKRSFAVGKFEVTFAEWDACIAAGGCSHFPDDRDWGHGFQPVIDVSWEDAKQYVRWLSARTGKRYRLLSEAEWEYAARAGTTTARHWGEEIGKGNAVCEGCDSPWDRIQPTWVGSFPPNAFGLHDLLGNVNEWVEDCWHDSYRGAPADGSAWITGVCKRRVLRGGNWFSPDDALTSAKRFLSEPDDRSTLDGFRVARDL